MVMCNHRVRVFGFLLAAIAAAGFAFAAPAQESQVSTRVIAFYHGWHGNPQTDGAYHNWNHPVADKSRRRFPGGQDIGTDFYPQAGCYSANDLKTLDRQMREVRAAGVGVLCSSWWERIARPINPAEASGLHRPRAPATNKGRRHAIGDAWFVLRRPNVPFAFEMFEPCIRSRGHRNLFAFPEQRLGDCNDEFHPIAELAGGIPRKERCNRLAAQKSVRVASKGHKLCQRTVHCMSS